MKLLGFFGIAHSKVHCPLLFIFEVFPIRFPCFAQFVAVVYYTLEMNPHPLVSVLLVIQLPHIKTTIYFEVATYSFYSFSS